MSKKKDPTFNEKVERLTMALDIAVPKGTKSYEVVYALCIILANNFINKSEENVDKKEYFLALKEIISDLIDKEENN